MSTSPESALKRADSHPIELDDVDTYLETRETDIADLTKRLDGAMKAKEAAETELAAATERFDADRVASNSAIAELQVKVAAADARVSERKTEIEELMADRARLIEEKDAAYDELELAKDAFERLEQVKEDLQSQIVSAKNTFDAERAHLNEERDALVARTDGLVAEKEAAIAALTDQMTQLAKEHVDVLKGLKAALEATVAQMRVAEAERDEAKAEVERINRELAELRVALTATQRELADANQFRAVAQNAMDDHITHYNAMKAQIEAIRAEVEGHQAMIASYKEKIAELSAIAEKGLDEQTGVYGTLKDTIGAMKKSVDAAAKAEIKNYTESLIKDTEIDKLREQLTSAETTAASATAENKKAIAALKVQLAAAEAERPRGVPDEEPMPTDTANLRDYISRRYQRSAQDARNIIAAARKLRDGTTKKTTEDGLMDKLEPIDDLIASPDTLPPPGGGAYLSRGGGALATAAQPIADFLSRRRVPVDVKTAFLGTGFVLLVACYAVVMALVSREWVVSLVSAAMAFIVLYVVAWTLVFLRWGLGGNVGLLIAHFAVLYFVLMFSVRGDTIPEDKKKRMEMLTVRVYSVWLLASLAVAFV